MTYLLVGQKVWAKNTQSDPEYWNDYLPKSGPPRYVPATVTSVSPEAVVVSLDWKPSEEVTGKPDDFPTMETADKPYPDLASLENLHEQGMVDNLQQRFIQNKMYTLSGDMLISINPNQPTYTEAGVSNHDYKMMVAVSQGRDEVIESFGAGAHFDDAGGAGVHLYTFIEATYRFTMRKRENRTLVIDGESASGKTEVLKRALEYMVNMHCVERTQKSLPSVRLVNHRQKVADQFLCNPLGSAEMPFIGRRLSFFEHLVLEARPIIESFGHARTSVNKNSSRVGTHCKLYFAGDGRVAGASWSTCMLEKLRVTKFSDRSERNFHAFYGLLASSAETNEKESLRLNRKISELRYLACDKQVQSIRDYNDAAEFRRTVSALQAFGLSDSEITQVKQTIAAIMHLGQVNYTGPQAEFASITRQTNVMGHIHNLLGLTEGSLDSLLLKSTLKLGNASKEEVPRSVEEALEVTDSLAKLLYENLFQFFISRINAHTAQTSARYQAALDDLKSIQFDAIEPTFIGFLDLQGFENGRKNTVQQFFVNLAAEKMQQVFVMHTFKREVALYESEGMQSHDYPDVPFSDNVEVLDMLEHKGHGILSLLEEASNWKQSTDSTFLAKMNTTYKKSKLFQRGKSQRASNSFVILHTANMVMYEAEGFVVTNRQRLGPDAMAILTTSSSGVMRTMFSNAVSGATAKPGTIRSHAKGVVEELGRVIESLDETKLAFIRCLKPNVDNTPDLLQPEFMLRQLQYSNVINAINMANDGFIVAFDFIDFYERYILVPRIEPPLVLLPPPGSDYQVLCRSLLNKLWDGYMPGVNQRSSVRWGRTLIFLRRFVYKQFETIRSVKLEDMDKATVLIQSVWRMYANCSKFIKGIEGMTRLQAAYHRRKPFKEFQAKHSKAAFLTWRVRAWLCMRRYRKQRQSVLRLQTWAQQSLGKLYWRRLRRGVHSLHYMARSYIIRGQVNKMLDALLVLQRNGREFITEMRKRRKRIWLATRVQAWFRGFETRIDHADIVDELTRHRHERYRRRCVFRLQSRWRGILFRVRYKQVKSATMTVQDWTRAKLDRRRFLLMRIAAIWIQSAIRGMKDRGVARDHVINSMVEDETWRVKNIREREVMQITKLHDASTADSESIREGSFRYALGDIDMMVDTTEVYPEGWAYTYGELEKSLMKKGKRCVSMAVGASHTIALTDGGEVYTWGWGDHGQLGHGGFKNEQDPRCVEALLYQMASFAGGRIQSGAGTASVKIKEIAAGDDFTVILADTGRVYTWGAGKRGQLGHGVTKNICAPRVVEAMKRRVTRIACGSHYTCVIGDPGTVYAWGMETMLGQGPTFEGSGDQALPLPVTVAYRTRKRRALDLACGRTHTVVSTQHGELYAWGNNTYGQLGQKDRNPRLTPTRIDTPWAKAARGVGEGERLNGFSCGARHNIAFSQSSVLAWGSNKFGQLGLGHTDDVLEPVTVPFFNGRRIAQLGAGWRSSVALTATNELFAWGQSNVVARTDADPETRVTVDGIQVNLTPKTLSLPQRSWRRPSQLQMVWSHTLSATSIIYAQMSADASAPPVNSSMLIREDMSEGPSPSVLTSMFSPQSIRSMNADQLKAAQQSMVAVSMDVEARKARAQHIHQKAKKSIEESMTQGEKVINWHSRDGKSDDPELSQKRRNWNANHGKAKSDILLKRQTQLDPTLDPKKLFRNKLTTFGGSQGAASDLRAPPVPPAAPGASITEDPTTSDAATNAEPSRGPDAASLAAREKEGSKDIGGLFSTDHLVMAMGGDRPSARSERANIPGPAGRVSKRQSTVRFGENSSGILRGGSSLLAGMKALKEVQSESKAASKLDYMTSDVSEMDADFSTRRSRSPSKSPQPQGKSRGKIPLRRGSTLSATATSTTGAQNWASSQSASQLEEQVEDLRSRLESSRKVTQSGISSLSVSKQRMQAESRTTNTGGANPATPGKDADLLSMIERIKRQGMQDAEYLWG